VSDLSTLLSKAPKAELHLHIEGSLTPKRMFELSQRNQVSLPFKSVEEVEEAYNFSNLQSFLDIYYSGAKVLIKEQDFYDMTWDYIEKCVEDKITHTEIFFDPQTHTDRGVEFETCFSGISKALDDALKKHGISSEIIMCFLRHLSEEEAFKTLEQSLPYKEKIIAVGLDSSEVGHPPSKFQKVFQKAREEGYLTVAHAGEEGPPEYIHEALDLLNVSRIDHGVRILEDVDLTKRVVKSQTPLTVCPLSNVKLRVFDTMEKSNFKKLMEAGLLVTVNSDDPTYFGGFLNENYEELARGQKLSIEDVALLLKNSFTASFLDEDSISKYHQEIDKVLSEIN
jgi:adenine deaminase